MTARPEGDASHPIGLREGTHVYEYAHNDPPDCIDPAEEVPIAPIHCGSTDRRSRLAESICWPTMHRMVRLAVLIR